MNPPPRPGENPQSSATEADEARVLHVCTVLPTYNERENIAPLIHGLLHHATRRQTVIVVDDDSPDGTAQVVREIAARFNTPGQPPLVWLEHRTTEKGLTSAIRHGIDIAIDKFQADIVTWMDCDLSMPPADVARLVETVAQGADMAVGSRWIPGGADIAHGPMAKTLSRVINLYAKMLVGGGLSDYTSGFIAARADLLRTIHFEGDYGEYCIDLLGQAVRKGYRVREVPYICVPRAQGESKTGITLWDYLVKGRKYVATGWRRARFRHTP